MGLPYLSSEDDFAKQLAAMVQQVWKDKGMPEGLINKEFTGEFAKRLWAGVTEGYGDKAKQFNDGSIDWDTPDAKMLAALQTNVWHFSAAKNYTQLRELSNALIGEDGKLRSEKDFIAAALAINEKHVKQYLKAEYQLAVVGSQSARMWQDFADDAMLEFDAIMDGRTTDLCRSLNGTTLPKSNPFWNVYMIPNHFGERSTVRQVYGRRATQPQDIPTADIPPMFQTNLGKQGLIFPQGHSYFINLPKQVLKQAEAMIIDTNFETRIQGKKGGYVDIHSLTDKNKKLEHIEVSKILADKGNQIKLMPEIHIGHPDQRKLFYPELLPSNASNPDARFNGILGDYKVPDNSYVLKKNIVDAINKTHKKQVSICAISLLDRTYNVQQVLAGIKGGLRDNNYVNEVWIIWSDKSVLKIPRGIANHKEFWKIIQTL